MTELMIAIAAWCSTPTHFRLDIFQVNACRQELIECIEKNKAFTDNAKIRQCFKEQKL